MSVTDFGDFGGLSYTEIERRYPELHRRWMDQPSEVEFPNGESFSKMRARIMAALTILRSRHAGQSVVVVTHGGVIRIAQRYAALNLIRFVEAYPVIELLNAPVEAL